MPRSTAIPMCLNESTAGSGEVTEAKLCRHLSLHVSTELLAQRLDVFVRRDTRGVNAVASGRSDDRDAIVAPQRREHGRSSSTGTTSRSSTYRPVGVLVNSRWMPSLVRSDG
jgi:hypothetical protein